MQTNETSQETDHTVLKQKCHLFDSKNCRLNKMYGGSVVGSALEKIEVIDLLLVFRGENQTSSVHFLFQIVSFWTLKVATDLIQINEP